MAPYAGYAVLARQHARHDTAAMFIAPPLFRHYATTPPPPIADGALRHASSAITRRQRCMPAMPLRQPLRRHYNIRH